jgi:kynurenine formamidase
VDNRQIPTGAEIENYLREGRNWGRWGNEGSAGAINLITPAKRVEAAGLVKSGKPVSLSRPLPVNPTPQNPRPVEHYMKAETGPDGRGSALDYVGIFPHGVSVTHIDALCHAWDQDGMWDGRDPAVEITFDGAKYGSVDVWSSGIMTRGVLLDVPKHRGEPYVTVDTPVHGWELEDIVREQDIEVGPGDAVLVYCGREEYSAANEDAFTEGTAMPGLHGSCLPFIRDHDAAVLGLDMLDASPNDSGIPLPVHGVLYAYGVAILDNALLEPLAEACLNEGRYEFLLTINPLVIQGGTGSAVNPIAVF